VLDFSFAQCVRGNLLRAHCALSTRTCASPLLPPPSTESCFLISSQNQHVWISAYPNRLFLSHLVAPWDRPLPLTRVVVNLSFLSFFFLFFISLFLLLCCWPVSMSQTLSLLVECGGLFSSLSLVSQIPSH
jgi:hypothetical protein